MKNKTIPLLTLCFISSLFFVSCNTTTAPVPMETTVPQATLQESIPTETPASTETAAPSPTPEPIPCNITFDTDRDGNREIYFMGSDGKDPTNLTNNPGEDSDPVWSPDGSQIAFVSNRVNDNGGGQFIYVMNADGSNVRQLTFEDESKSPDWSHDSRQITYIHKGEIYKINSDGSGPSVNLTNSPEPDEQSSWSPDGSKIAWLSGINGKRNIFVMNPDGSNVQQLTDNGRVSDITWTVDNEIFTHWEQPEGLCFNCVMAADGSNARDAGGKGELQRYMPFWTVDGNRVECVFGNFITPDNEIFLVGEVFPDIFLNLTNNPADDQNPDWPANCGPTGNKPVASTEQPEKTQSQNPGQLIIGYESSSNSMSVQNETDLLKACDELKIECIKGQDIGTLAEQNVNAILSFSNRWQVMGDYPKIHAAREKGFLVIILNAETSEQGAYNLSVESASIRSSLEWMFNEMEQSGELAYFNFGQNEFHQTLIDQALKDYPNIKAISIPANYEGNTLTEKSVAALASANPNLKAIWTDEKQTDVFWGLRNNKIQPIPAILCEPRADMLQFWKDWTNDKTSFKCFATIKPGGTGYEGVYLAYYLLNGKEIKATALGGEYGNTLFYDYPKITNDNLDEWLGQLDTLRKGDWDILEMPPMTPQEILDKWFIE